MSLIVPNLGHTLPATGVLRIVVPAPPRPRPVVDPARIPQLIQAPPPPPPPPTLVPESWYLPGFRRAGDDERMTSSERAKAILRTFQGGGTTLVPKVNVPVNPAMPKSLYTAGEIAYLVGGAGFGEGKVKVSPLMLGGWFVAPKPLGFQDPLAYGISRRALFPTMFEELRTFALEDVAGGRLRAQRQFTGDSAISRASYLDSRARLAGVPTAQLEALATVQRLPVNWNWIDRVPSGRRALADELQSRQAIIPRVYLRTLYDPPISDRIGGGVANQHGDP